jgi:cell wall-associated NlpC family hydrolase/LysM repeat protein
LIIAFAAGAILASRPDYAPAQIHVVREGESLTRVANEYQVAYQDLAAANPAIDSRRLKGGEVVLIPARFDYQAPSQVLVQNSTTRTYAVENGDNDWSISRALGISRAELHRLNPGIDWTKLQVGQKLIVPGGKAASPKGISAKSARVVASNVIVRSGPGVDHSRVAMVQKGASGAVLAQRDGWVKIRLSSSTEGWIRADLVSAGAQAAPRPAPVKPAAQPAPIGPKVKVVRQGVNLRSGGSEERPVVGSVALNEVLSVRSREGGWLKVSTRSGQIGWVRSDMTVPIDEPSSARPSPVAAPAPTGSRVKVVKTDVRVRSGASTSQKVVGKVDSGAVGAVRDRKNGWIKAEFSNGVTGWVRADMVQAITTQQAVKSAQAPKPAAKAIPAALASAAYVRAKGDSVRLRSGPSVERSQVGSVSSGDFGKVLEVKGDWVKAEWVGKRAAWARADFLSPMSASEAEALIQKRRSAPPRTKPSAPSAAVAGGAAAIISTAQAQAGIRYRWGGTSRSGFDCSGFTSYVFAKHGVRLPRTSIEQSRFGQAVSRGSLQPGDLVFFKTRGSRVSHVGIYTGGGRFIHASSGGGRVTTSSLTGYYDRRYAGARRVLKAGSSVVRSAAEIQTSQAAPAPAAPREQEPEVYSPLTPVLPGEARAVPITPPPASGAGSLPPPQAEPQEEAAPPSRVRTGVTSVSK